VLKENQQYQKLLFTIFEEQQIFAAFTTSKNATTAKQSIE